MSDIVSVVVDLAKELSASAAATLDVLLEKGLIEPEDIKRWELVKARNLAKLDQMQSEARDRMTQQIREAAEREFAAILMAQGSTEDTKEPKQGFFRTLLSRIF